MNDFVNYFSAGRSDKNTLSSSSTSSSFHTVNTGSNDNNNNQNIENIESSKEPEFFPIACKNCRQVHKRCDKKLPSCSSCIRKGLVCTYATPKRKGRKCKGENLTAETTDHNENHRFQPYPSVNQTMQSSSGSSTEKGHLNLFKKDLDKTISNLSYSFVKQNVELSLVALRKQSIEMYKIVSPPVIPTNVFEYLITSTLGVEEIGLDGKALLYAVHANIEQRLGSSDLRTKECIESAKKLMDLVSSDWSNNRVITAKYFLSFCLLGNGRHKEAQYYLRQMDFAVKELENKSQLDHEEKMLMKMNDFAKIEISEGIDADNESLYSLSFPNVMFKRYPIIFKLISENLIPPPQKLFPIESLVKENLLTHLQTIEKIASIIVFSLTVYCDKAKLLELRLVQVLLKNMMKLLCIKAIDKMETKFTIQFSCAIADAIDDDYFCMLPSQAIIPIAISAKEIMRVMSIVYSGELQANSADINLFDLLRRHLEGINKLKAKYKRVEVYYGNVINEIEMALDPNTRFGNNNNFEFNNGDNTTTIDDENGPFSLNANLFFEFPTDLYFDNNVGNSPTTTKTSTIDENEQLDLSEVDMLLQELISDDSTTE